MWQTILQIGSLAGLLSLVGGVYLYFENRRFKKLNATKEYEIALADVRGFDDERAKKLVELEETKRGLARGVSFEANRTFWETAANTEQSIKFDQSPAETKARARVRYYKRLKEHKFLWFLRGSRGNPVGELTLD